MIKEAKLIGKLLPSHPDILPILNDVREKYQIPEISPGDNSIKILLEHGLEIDWIAIKAEILERLKETDLLPEKTKKSYDSLKKLKTIGLVDPELEKVSQEFKDNLFKLLDMLVKQYEPFLENIDRLFEELAELCIVYLMTGEAHPIADDWLVRVDVMDTAGEKVVFAMANQAADPDEVAEMFKKKFYKTFGKRRPKVSEKHVKAADYLRMRYEGKSIAYLLEEEDIRESQESKERSSSRHSTAVRKRHDKMRQKLHRLQKTIDALFV